MDDASEKSADVIDAANDLAFKRNEAMVQAARQRNKPEQKQNEDGSWPITECEDCGDGLTDLRLQMARVRCVPCQTIREKRASR